MNISAFGGNVISNAKQAAGRAGFLALATLHGPTRAAAMGIIKSGARSALRPTLTYAGMGTVLGAGLGAWNAQRRGESAGWGAFRGALGGAFTLGVGGGFAGHLGSKLGSPFGPLSLTQLVGAEGRAMRGLPGMKGKLAGRMIDWHMGWR